MPNDNSPAGEPNAKSMTKSKCLKREKRQKRTISLSIWELGIGI